MGAGINRMNIHTVRHATQGLATLIAGMGKAARERGVAVCMDWRHNSDIFAKEAASVLAANEIKVYLFDAPRPTPELSFAVRAIECIAGINITASHNPKEYNGYKVYWEDGAQLPPDHAEVVAKTIAKTDIFSEIKLMDYDRALKKGLITLIGEEVDESFLFHVLEMSINREAVGQVADTLKIVYTPFHGTGAQLVPEALRRLGLKHILCEPEQMRPDGGFSTVKSPNPENKESFKLAIELAKRENAELIIGTDPDADRVGIVVLKSGGEYVPLTGNQVGVLLLDYIINARKSAGTLPENPAAIKTIVTTEMARAAAEANGVRMFDTFTGFKFMAEKIKELETAGSHEYLLAFEESYGYLMGGFCRDKDAVTASMMIAELAAYCKTRGKTLYEAMRDLYEKYGSYAEETINIVMPGIDGLEKMEKLMSGLRENPPESIAGTEVLRVRDYLGGKIFDFKSRETSETEISGSNVLYFELSDDTRFIIRPSGTEPKIKIYILTHADSMEECGERISKYRAAAEKLKD
jgi:phosphoglucomutase